MAPNQFDRVAKRFAARRSRRAVLGTGGAGLAAALASALPATARQATASAQEASPVAGDGGKVPFLFVQSFESGALAPATPSSTPGTATPAAGGGADYTLTVSHGLGQTLFFSDRPERVVGALPTPQFLDALGFPADNPPNAALVAALGDGNEEILIVELFDPTYDEASRTATYGVRILEDDERVGMEFVQDPHWGGAHPAETYGASHLFIDDCPDITVCVDPDDINCGCQVIPGGPYGTCWQWWDPIGCSPCSVTTAYLDDVCNQAYPGWVSG